MDFIDETQRSWTVVWKRQKSVSDTLGLVHPKSGVMLLQPGQGKKESHGPAFFIGTLIIRSAASVVLPTQAIRPGAWERDNNNEKLS
jgi:hypothetical protein